MSGSEDAPECSTCGRKKTYSAKYRGYVCPGCAWNRFMGRDPRPPTDQHTLADEDDWRGDDR